MLHLLDVVSYVAARANDGEVPRVHRPAYRGSGPTGCVDVHSSESQSDACALLFM